MNRKRTIKTVILGSSISMLFLSGANAQVTISGEITPRTEYRNGFKKLTTDDTEPALFTEQRTRLKTFYNSEKLQFNISLQDVRIWGSVNQIYKSDPSLTNIHEAWFNYKPTDNLGLKIGRQELNYDNARFLGNLGWAMQSRSHDLIKFTFTDSLYSIHIGTAFNQDANTPEFRKLTSTFYSGVNNYKTMQYLWGHIDLSAASLSLLVLNNGVQTGNIDTSDVNYTQTIGLYGKSGIGKLALEAEFYYQTGENLSAYLIAASAGYKGLKSITPSIGFDLLSGTESGATENNSFTPLYGTNHKFYGFMDYFYVGNPHGNLGLLDIYAKAAFKLGSKSTLLAHVHQFYSAVDVVDAADASITYDKAFGQEIDIVYNLNISKAINLKAGYSQLLGTETLEYVKGGDASALNNWAWVMMSVKPVFFKN